VVSFSEVYILEQLLILTFVVMSKKESDFILNDKHEIFSQYSSQCAFCSNHRGDYTCLAFPEGIPGDLLDGSKKHNSPIPSQTGALLFQKKEEYSNYDI
jgi:hypothetical protein